MKTRILTGTLLAAIFLPVLLVDKLFILFQIMMCALALFASVELINMYEKRHKFPLLVKIITVVLTLLLYLSFLTEFEPTSLAAKALTLYNLRFGFIPTFIVIVMIMLLLMVIYRDFNGASIGRALTAILYPGLGFGAITLLRAAGLEFVLYLFCVTVFTDVFAYFTGYFFGKHKMSPYISPKKTWEGAFGGTFIATICGVAFCLLYNKCLGHTGFTIFDNCGYMAADFNRLSKVFKIVFIVILTITLSICGQVGDLVASKFKRTYEIKDYSNIFPGHGGVLDRLDSAIYVAMFLFTVIVLYTNLAAGF